MGFQVCFCVLSSVEVSKVFYFLSILRTSVRLSEPWKSLVNLHNFGAHVHYEDILFVMQVSSEMSSQLTKLCLHKVQSHKNLYK